MDYVVLIGRILFTAIFLGGAAGHLTSTTPMAQLTASKGVPQARSVVIGSGLLMVAASIMIILGVWADLGALLLFVFLVPTAFVMHSFWRESDPQMKLMEQLHFNKDLSLAGAALFLMGFVVHTQERFDLFLTAPLFPRIF